MTIANGRCESDPIACDNAAGNKPSVATMLVASLGLVPAATSHGIGSDSQRPFAIVIVGGLMAVLVMSIFLLPALYIWFAGPNDRLPVPDGHEG